jgi:hypothetical protein
MHRVVVLVVTVSVIAIATVVGLGMTNHTTPAAGGTVAWPQTGKRNAQAPYLDCGSGLSTATSYDRFGPGLSSTPVDAVLDALHEGGTDALGGYNNDLIADVTADDLVPIWRYDSDYGTTVSLLLTIDGRNVALFNVGHTLIAEGEPITWRESGWGVDQSFSCEITTGG